MRKLSLLVMLCCLSVAGMAQTAASYVLTSFIAAADPVPDTTNLYGINGDNLTKTGVNIGFTFNYCGTDYTTMSVCSNGWISFLNATTTVATNTQTAMPSTGTGVLMPFWDDLNGSTAITARVAVSGSAPNRICQVEWGGWGINSPGSGTGTVRVILHETTNVIEFFYKGFPAFTGASATIGIANGPVDFRTLTNVGATLTSSTSTFTTNITTSPSSAQWYRFTPASSTPPITGTLAVCVGASTSLSTTATGGSWSSSSPLVATINSSGIATGNTAGTATISYVTGTSTATATITVNTTPTISGAGNVCVGSSLTLTAAGGGSWSTGSSSISVTGGTVTGISAGSAFVTYTLPTGCSSTSLITVYPVPVITGTATTSVGSTTTLATTSGSGAWSSASPAIATVNSSTGVVTGVAAGTASIQYTLSSTGCSAARIVTVTASTADRGLNFDGNNDYVYVPGGLPGAVSNLTYEAWVRPELLDGNFHTIIANDAFSAGQVHFQFNSSNLLEFAVAGAIPSNQVSSFTFAVNTWYHIAAVYSATANTLKIYVNGTLTDDLTYSGTIPLPATQPYTIGGWYHGGIDRSFKGTIDEVRVWDVARTGSQIVSAMNCDIPQNTNLKAYYRFNQGTAGGTNTSITSASDFSGVGNCAELHNFTLTGSTSNFVTGAIGTCDATASSTVYAGIISGGSSVTVSGTLALTENVSGGVWSVSNANATINTTGVVTGVAIGTTVITYTVTNSCGSTFAIKTLNVLPGLGPITGTASVCVGATTTLSNSATGGAWSSNTTAVATVNSTGVVTGIANGTSVISYTVGSSYTTTVVTVNPLPSAITGTTSTCVGSATTLSDATSGGTWSSTSLGVASISSSGVLSGIAAGSTTVYYTLPTGCRSSVTAIVNALPAAISGPGVVCAGSFITLTDATTGGLSWTSSDTTIARINSSGIVTGMSAGTVNVTYTLSTGCIATTNITVNPLPSAITGATAYCVGGSATLSSASTGGTWTSGATTVAVINPTTGVISAGAAGTATITYTLPSGCKNTLVVTVSPVPGTITGVTSLCSGTSVTLSNTVTGGSWSSNNTAVATVGTNGVVTAAATGSATITYMLAAGCYATTVVSVATAIPAIGDAGLHCVGIPAALTNSASGGTWSSSNTGVVTIVSTTGLSTGVSAGTANITYTFTPGCKSILTITVSPTPAAITGTASACAGLTTTYSTTTTGGTWISSNTAVATISSTGVITGMAAGTAIISYIMPTGCYVTKVVTINPLPAAIAGTTSACVGSIANLTDATTGGLSWTSSNTSIATINSSGVVSGVSAGSVTITYTLTTGCYTTTTFVVNPLPSAIAGAPYVCIGSTSALSNTITGGTWLSGSTGVASVGATSGVVSGLSAGTSIITYTLGSGCRTFLTVTVGSLPSAISGPSSVCAGSTISLGNATPGGTWSSNNTAIATISTSGVVTGVATGSTTITYSVGTGCYTTYAISVTTGVSAISGPSIVCVGSSATFTDATTGGTWSSSNTSLATVTTSGVVTGVIAGSVNITYATSATCRSVLPVTIAPAPAAITGASSVCVGSTTSFTAGTGGGTWSSSNPAVASVTSTGLVSGITAGGSATITYTVSTGCYVTKLVGVASLPGAIVGTLTVCPGSTTALSNPTTGGTSWTSSNTSVATISSSGIVTGVAAGTATVTYTVSTGCITTAVITVNPLPAAIGGTATVCSGATTTFTNTTTGGTWSSSNTAVATVGGTGLVSGIAAGTTSISYTLGTGCGTAVVLTVIAAPATVSGPSSVCISSTATFTSATSGGTWLSNTPTVASVNSSTGVVTGLASGSATISYIMPSGCYSTAFITIAPLSSIIGTASTCIGSTTTLTHAVSTGTWSSSNTAIATVGLGTGIVTGVAAGTATITYTVSSGCFKTIVATVNSLPTAISGPTSVCQAATISLSNSTAGGTWSSSNISVASVTSTGLVSGLSAGTAYITYTLPTGCTSVQLITVNSNPLPITGNTSLCVSTSTTLADASGGGVSWTSSNIGVANVTTISGVVTGNAIGTATITFTQSTGCYATTTVTVNALPSAIAGGTVVCAGSSTLLSATPSGGVWSSTAPGAATVTSGGMVTGVAAGTATISYTIGSGCVSTTIITINPVPVAITGASVVCVGSSTPIATLTTGGVWASSTPTVAAITSTGIVTGLATGTALMQYILTTGCSASLLVTVSPAVPAITGTAVTCLGLTTTLANTATGGTWTSSSDATASINSAGLVTGNGAGTATITYSLSAGCSAMRVVTVNAGPSAITGTMVVCANGSTTTLSSASAGGTWTSSNSGIASADLTTGIITGVNGGTAIITYAIGTSCRAYAVVTVNAVPYFIAGPASICAGSTAMYTNITSGGAWTSSTPTVATMASTGALTALTTGTTTVSYTLPTGCARATVVTVNATPSAILGVTNVCVGSITNLTHAAGSGTWTSSNTTIATVEPTAGVVTGVAAGTATITYTLSAGCTAVTNVTVNALPADITGMPITCVGATTTLASATTGGTWSSSNIAVATAGTSTGIITGITSGSSFITYMLPTGCITTTILTVNPTPFASTGATSICVGATTVMVNTTPGGILWSSSNPTVASIGSASGVVTGNSIGTTTITYHISSGCISTTIVSVSSAPAAITGTTLLCDGGTAALGATPAGGAWSSSNTAVAVIGTSGIVTATHAGTALITYSIGAGCNSVTMVSVNPVPNAITGASTVCLGQTATLVSTTPGGSWSSSNTAKATVGTASGIVSSVDTGNVIIIYTLPTGCSATRFISVNFSLPAITGTSTACIGTSTILANATLGGSWTSSSTGIAIVGSTSGIVTGASAGTATITYSVGAGCTATRLVTISSSPAQITGAGVTCVGSNTAFFNTDGGGTWSSSNMAVATIGSSTGIATGLTAGTSIITYALSAGCRDLEILTVNALPAAITGATSMCSGSVTALGSTSTGGVWSSGNPGVATVSGTGMVTAVSTGTATISYTLATGCMRSVIVTVASSPAAIAGIPVVCTGATTTLSHPSTGGMWSSSSTGIATIGSSTGIVTGVAAGVATITYNITSGCMSIVAVTVNGVPTAISGTASTCVGSATTLSSSPAGGVWTSSNTSVATVNSSTGVVAGVSTGTTLITYTSGTGCAAKVTLTVNSAPMPISGATVLCTGGVTVLTSSPTGVSWTSSNTAVATIGVSSGVLTGVSTGTTTITYLFSTGCTSTTVVTVQAMPSAIVGGTTICAGSTSPLVSSPAGGTWSSSNSAVAPVDASGTVSAITAGTARITYSTGVGCNVTALVTVSPVPAAITGATTVCIGLTSTLSSTTTGGIWSSSNTSVATVSSTGVVSSVAIGTSVITYTALTGCNATTVITVAPSLAANTGTATTCIGLTTTLANATTGGSWSSSNTAVATAGTGGVVTGMAAGTATITYSIGAGCTATTVVTVNGAPAAIGGTLAVCAGSTTALSNTDAGGTWTSSNATVATVGASTGVVSGNVMGTSIITYSLSAGCKRVSIVTVNPLPGAITGATTMCNGSVTNLSTTTTGGIWISSNTAVATVSGTGMVTALSTGTTAITYVLPTGCMQTAIVTVGSSAAAITGTPEVCVGATTTLSNPSTGGTWSTSSAGIATVGSSTGVVTGVAAGNATITYYTGAGCMATTTVTVDANPATISGTPLTCIGSTTTFSNATTGGVWISDNSSIADVDASTGIVSGISAGTTTITYVLATGCYKTKTVTVNGTPSAISGITSMCVGAVTVLTASPTGVSWTSSNTSVATIGVSSGVVTAVGIGTTTITYLFSTGCTSTTVVSVNAAPAGITGATAVCAGNTAALSSATTGGTWTSTTPAVASINATTGFLTAVAAGTTNITYNTGVGCTSTATVTVNALPTAIGGTATVCPGTSVTLTDATVGGAWSSADGTIASVSTSGVLTGVSTGATTISYTLATGCARTLAVSVTSGLSAITGTLTTCIGLSTVLSDATSGGTWSSSNTAKANVGATTGIVTGVAGGTATITYASGTGCYTTAVVTVITSPAAITGTLGICNGGNTTLSSTDAGGTWSSSNTAIAPVVSTTGLVTGTAAGTAIITYSLSGGCRAITMVTVFALPSAITGVTTICNASTATLSSGPAGGTWSSSATSVVTVGTGGIISGISAGVATISYTQPSGCFRTAQVTVNTLSPITGNFNLCVSQVNVFANATSGGVWTSSAGTIASVSAGNVTGVSAGTARITYTLAAGCYAIAPVTVNTQPAVITGAASVCVNAVATVADATTGGVWSSSNSSIAVIDPSTGDITGIAAGTPTISYTNANGCYRTKVVPVKALPVAIAGNAPVCVGGHIIVSDATPTGVSWTSSNPSIATINVSSGLVTGVSGGFTTITYLANSGCFTTAIVTVQTAPVAGTITGPSTVSIIASPILFTDAAAGGFWSTSNNGVATVGATTGQVTGVTAGPVTLSYSVSNACGTAIATLPVTITSPKAGGNVSATVNAVNLYPNPTSGTFTITALSVGTFTMYTLEGKEVMSTTVAEGANTMSMPKGLANGVYMCRYTGNDGSAVMVRLVYEQ